MSSSKTKLVIEFDNEKARHHFAMWLCESGEQDYWDWMSVRETEEDGSITAVSFDYHNRRGGMAADDPEAYGDFLEDGTIRTICGRLDGDL